MPFSNIEMAGGIFQGSAGWRGPCPVLYSRKNLFLIINPKVGDIDWRGVLIYDALID
jgi:hypothetical protein